MGVSQPNIARAESGSLGVGVDFIDRWARATGEVITLSFGRETDISFEERGARVRAALGQNRFDPWKRRLTDVERKSLISERIPRSSTRG